MPDNESRLLTCFQAVFPDLSDADLKRATTDRVSAWDSVASVTLAATVEEEFGIQLAPEDIEKLNSFARYREYVDR
jgi:acyl carrier protein